MPRTNSKALGSNYLIVLQFLIHPLRLRRYFAALLVNAAPPQPRDIFEEVLDRLWPPAGRSYQTREWRRRKTLNHLEYCFRQFNTTCR